MQTTSTPEATRDQHRSRRRPVVRWVLGVLVVFVTAGAALTVITLAGVRSELEGGRQALVSARRALLQGDLGRSEEMLLQAQEAFARAQAETSGLGAGLARLTPLLGRNIVVARGVAESGAALSRAGLGLVQGIGELPGGLDALAPQAGRFPLEALGALAISAEGSARDAEMALDAITETPETLLLPPVAQARWDAEAEVRDATEALVGARDLLAGLPAFAGAEGPRRYLFFAENPAELRSTGGLWGAYSVLTIQDGRLDFDGFRPIALLRELDPDDVPPPSADFRENYDQYGGAGNWRNMNVTPDFPTASRAALASWEILRGDRLDGVLSADPFALRSILRVTGPTIVPSLDRTLGPANVVRYVSNKAYGRFEDGGSRKEVIGQAAEAALTQLLTMQGRGLERLRAIADAAGSGHLKVYVTEPLLQDALARSAVGGALAAVPTGDLLAVYVNNASESKIDFYIRRTVSYQVRLGGDREAFGTTLVKLENEAPTEGPPRVVLGPNSSEAEAPGDEVHVLSTWCPAECRLAGAERDAREIKVREGLEGGRRFYYDFGRLQAGGTSTFRTVTKRVGTWQGDLSSGSYRLTILPQTTIIPTQFAVRIVAPEGTNIVWASEPLEVAGGTATWAGVVPDGPLTLEVRFQAPVPARWWRNVTGLFG